MAPSRSGNSSRRCNCPIRPGHRACGCYPYKSFSRKDRRVGSPVEHAVTARNSLNDFDSFEEQLILLEGPQSPESTLSVVSHGNVSIDSSCSTTAELGRRRLYTPLAVTPTSSEASSEYFFGCNYPQSDPYAPYINDGQTWNNTFGGGQHCLSPVDRNPIPLAGIAQTPSYEEAATFVQPRVEFVSPHGPSPISHQTYPPLPEPWSGHPLRHEDPMILDRNLDPVATAVSPTSSAGDKAGRRVGPLTSAQRKKANAVRIKGACLRCSYMKENCDDNEFCGNCDSKKGRKWKLGCIRKKLHEKKEYLFPAQLEYRYARTRVNEYVENSAFFYKNRPEFHLNLDVRLPGRPLQVLVKEVEMVYPTRQESYGFRANNDTGAAVQKSPTWSPPVVLYLKDGAGDIAKIRAQLTLWMRNVFATQENVKYPLSPWPWPCFPSAENNFEGEIAHTVFKYWRRDLPSHAILEKAHCLLFFGYLLDHPFMVSDTALDELLANLQSPRSKESLQGVTVSPDTITRFIRMLVFPLAVEVADSLLKALHELLHNMALGKETSTAKTDMAFCLSFTLLVFLSFTQSRVLFLSDYPEHETGLSLNTEQACNIIRDMERELAIYIIHFHEFALKRRRHVKTTTRVADECEQHAMKFGLMQEVRRLTTDYSETQPPNLKLRTIDIDKFDVENVHRLCWKFIDAIGLE